ncbi:MAG TPA: hypothetical protein DCL60_08105, partial [Armatimonadetes bacterium]|nr:hypothetical protein [Armatimonadota bacterium]
NDKKLAWICQARASLRDIGMGASPGYIEECKPMSDAMVRFAGEIVGTPLVNKSYALRLNGLADRDGDLYTSGWVNKNRI